MSVVVTKRKYRRHPKVGSISGSRPQIWSLTQGAIISPTKMRRNDLLRHMCSFPTVSRHLNLSSSVKRPTDSESHYEEMREELKGRNLSFTEIAKLVGENWQNLSPAEKEPFESQAQAIKDKYLSDLSEYKKTPEYRKYQSYLHEFKLKHASPSQGMHPGIQVHFTPVLMSHLLHRQGCLKTTEARRVG